LKLNNNKYMGFKFNITKDQKLRNNPTPKPKTVPRHKMQPPADPSNLWGDLDFQELIKNERKTTVKEYDPSFIERALRRSLAILEIPHMEELQPSDILSRVDFTTTVNQPRRISVKTGLSYLDLLRSTTYDRDQIIKKIYPLVAKELISVDKCEVPYSHPLFREMLLPHLFRTDVSEKEIMDRFIMLTHENILQDFFSAYFSGLSTLGVFITKRDVRIIVDRQITRHQYKILIEGVCLLLEISPTLLHAEVDALVRYYEKQLPMFYWGDTGKAMMSGKKEPPEYIKNAQEIQFFYCHDGRQPQPKNRT